MLIRMDSKFIDDSVVECFNSLRSEGDSLVEAAAEAGMDVSETCSIAIEVAVEDDSALISVGTLGLEYKVSVDEVKDTLLDTIGLVLGYQRCVLQGFTAKSPSGDKLRPKVPVFVKSTLGFKVPETLEYMRKQEANPVEVIEDRLVPFVSNDPIIRSILAGPLRFSSDGIEVLLVRTEDGMYMMPNTMETLPMVQRTVGSMNLDIFLTHLERYTFGFVRVFIDAYRSPLSTKTDDSLTECFVELRDNHSRVEMECIREIVSSAPVFLDDRDGITRRIEQFYVRNYKGDRGKATGYLSYRKETNIDRSPIGSLKRYLEDK